MAVIIGAHATTSLRTALSERPETHLLDDITRMRCWAKEQWVWDQLNALHRPALWRSLAASLGDWLVIFGAFGAVVLWGVLVVPFALILIGNRQRALGNLMHDASHGSFGGNRRLADALADGLLFLPLCTMLTLYRSEHIAHHRHLGSPDRDGDLIHSEEDMTCSWPGLLWRHVTNERIWIGSVFGHVLRADVRTRCRMLGWWGIVILAITVVMRPADALLFATLWLASRATTFHLITTFREISDHVGLIPGTILGFSRNQTAGGLLGALLHPHNNGYHLAHHLNPAIPFFALPRAHSLLLGWPEYAAAANTDQYFFGTSALVRSWVRRSASLAKMRT